MNPMYNNNNNKQSNMYDSGIRNNCFNILYNKKNLCIKSNKKYNYYN